MSVSFATSSGSATAESDFTSASGTLTWADGDAANKTITVDITSDTVDESDESFVVALSSPSGGALLGSNRNATVTIIDDDASGGGGDVRVDLDRSALTIGEGAGPVNFTVLRSGSASGAVSVSYATTPGSATAESDFTSASGTLTWADGDTAVKTITVNMTNDSTDESDETFTVTLSNPSGGATLGSSFQATVTIVDDDSPVPPPQPPPTPSPHTDTIGRQLRGRRTGISFPAVARYCSICPPAVPGRPIALDSATSPVGVAPEN